MLGKIIKWFFSLTRLVRLKLKYRGRLVLDYCENKKMIYFGKRISVCIDKNAILKIGGGTYFSDDCQIAIMENAKAELGTNIYIGKGSRLFIRDGFHCGNNVLIADNVSIYDHNHQYRELNKSINSQGFTKARIEIGEDSWLSTNVVVCQGATVGNHVVVGANAVVQGCLENRTVYVSNKAVKIKEMG